MVSCGITMDGLPKSIVDQCSLRVPTNLVLCAQHGEWINVGCAGMKGMTGKI